MGRRQRGSIRKRGPNKWIVRVYVGTTANGRRKYSSATVHGTMTDAKAKRTEMLYELDRSEFVEASATTVKAYVEAWIDGKTCGKEPAWITALA